jgi:succinate dehydrogenase flavin-adding protein (antitoxin of CptAB toxin-antitoxin module)
MGIFGTLIIVAILVYLFRNSFTGRNLETKDDRYNAARNRRMEELDSLLDKINKHGIDSLSDYERKRLDELSGNK